MFGSLVAVCVLLVGVLLVGGGWVGGGAQLEARRMLAGSVFARFLLRGYLFIGEGIISLGDGGL